VRRIALIAALLLASGGALLVASAGAEDSHTYRVELDNAFGLVNGSEVRVAGVTAGTVTDLDVNAAKRAVVTVELSGPLSSLRQSATCSSEPQSLIAEYFLDCQPGKAGPELADGGQIPVHSERYGDQSFTTVQNDLVQNTLREPFKQRLALILNEFGTGLAGNPQNLNAAIRRGAPALRALHEVVAVLARQNRVIRDLNVNSDRIIARLAQRRGDVVRFIDNANRTAAASAERRADISRDFELLPGFLAELRPALTQLGELADQQTPLLADLDASAGQLARLTVALPAFNDALAPALESLGSASEPGRRALTAGADEIRALRRASQKSYPVADQLANFLVDLDDRDRAVEPDPRSPGGEGFTGFENLINYIYYQPGAINQYDEVGHYLHFSVYEPNNPCTSYATGVDGVPARGGGTTRNAAERAPCVSWVGPSQTGINAPSPYPPYDPSVCPHGSTRPDLCRPPGGARQQAETPGVRSGLPAPSTAAPTGDSGGAGSEGEPEYPSAVPLPGQPAVPGPPNLPELPNLPGLDGGATNDLLDFLFGS
jgi:ABC-type transporter Mla subunit MlaD